MNNKDKLFLDKTFLSETDKTVTEDANKNDNSVINKNIILCKDITLFGFELEDIELSGNFIIFCSKQYEVIRNIYSLLKLRSSGYYISSKVVVSPLERFQFKLVIKFINRDIDCYQKGCIPKENNPDNIREKEFFNGIDISYIDEIIYVGDVIRL